MTAGPYKIAISQYPIEAHASFSSFEVKLESWVAEAAKAGAKLLVFPEYGAMELTSILPADIAGDLQKSLEGMQQFYADFEIAHHRLAVKYGVYILASSFPHNRRNAAGLYSPSGARGVQEKLIMTRFENEEWGIKPGEGGLTLFETEIGNIGVAICYDSEFPLIGRALAEAGADIILVPSCTDTQAGYWRVRIGAQARALENQCFVVQSPLVGEAPWSPATDINVGAAGFFGPPDRGFPDDGVFVVGEMNVPGWVYGEIDTNLIRKVRTEGQVLNYRDWPEQGGCELPRVKKEKIR